MFIVHSHWSGPEGAEYRIAGVYSTKKKAMESALKVAESLTGTSEDDTIEDNGDGYLVEIMEDSFVNGEAESLHVLVEEIALNTDVALGDFVNCS